jgi:HK97 family phage prohead protease
MKITGYPITFGTVSTDLGGFVETIRASAVDRALRERTDVVALRNHDPTLVLGRAAAGTLVMRKESRGLFVELD